MKAEQTGVILIEFQNDFCKDGGKLHDGVKVEMARLGTIANAVRLADGARKKGALVVHAPFVFNPDYFEQHQMAGIIKAVADTGSFRKDTWGAAVIEELTPQSGDQVVGGKATLCGFHNTDLERILRSNGIKNVAVAGFLTNFCVESTCRSAYDKGYGVTMIKDAVASQSADEQAYVEAKIIPLIGQAMTTDQFLGQLE